MDARLQLQVWHRARKRCKYCRFPARLTRVAFRIDHIIAEKHGTPTNSRTSANQFCVRTTKCILSLMSHADVLRLTLFEKAPISLAHSLSTSQSQLTDMQIQPSLPGFFNGTLVDYD